jgi:hypothetical protein
LNYVLFSLHLNLQVWFCTYKIVLYMVFRCSESVVMNSSNPEPRIAEFTFWQFPQSFTFHWYPHAVYVFIAA